MLAHMLNRWAGLDWVLESGHYAKPTMVWSAPESKQHQVTSTRCFLRVHPLLLCHHVPLPHMTGTLSSLEPLPAMVRSEMFMLLLAQDKSGRPLEPGCKTPTRAFEMFSLDVLEIQARAWHMLNCSAIDTRSPRNIHILCLCQTHVSQHPGWP